MPSQRDGRTTTSAARYQGTVSSTAPVNRTEGPAAARRASPSGPSPTRTSRAVGTSASTEGQAASRTSCPFWRQSRPTQTTVGAGSPGGPSLANRAVSTPLWMTDQSAATPAASPVRRSASLTQTIRSAHRAPNRSQRRATAAVVPSTAAKDQACG